MRYKTEVPLMFCRYNTIRDLEVTLTELPNA